MLKKKYLLTRSSTEAFPKSNYNYTFYKTSYSFQKMATIYSSLSVYGKIFIYTNQPDSIVDCFSSLLPIFTLIAINQNSISFLKSMRLNMLTCLGLLPSHDFAFEDLVVSINSLKYDAVLLYILD